MVIELTIHDVGVWIVHTQGSIHILDLDNKTATRVPGAGRTSSINDRTRPLRTLETCRVGERGRWTMTSDDPMTDHYWHVTSTIRAIQPRET
ncbi:hypothetical protein [Paramicrobacterium agarici]|uniref:hypothetical protein n=1 Tax=Paramicrobacterium agarici TaxID=630514 RepID=UPI00115248ED|nr:hypothetical protein [Microbacterium agarici]TQO22272.1 hypothetical protein FB385_1098 [Microbacterium agarici]